ncbi:MAG: universal stress protein [Chitinophagaceae bacterium]|nr:universal stress protein [Chitinophagaceae bacterium]
MKTIIVATDFSPASNTALHYGMDMARMINASLLLFHAYQVPVSYSDTPIVLVSVDELKHSAEQQLEKLKGEVEHIVSGSIKVYAEARLGNTTDELETLCEKINPFAIVMGARGSSGIETTIFGSTTLTSIRHLKWPVITVPQGKEFGNAIRKVGFACDFREVVQTTPVDVIRNIVKTFSAELHVLNVDHHEKHFRPDTPEQSALLHTMLEDCKPVYHFIEHKDVEDGINEFAEKNNIDLIVAIPKRHKLLQGLFKPSSTKQLVFQSHIPVLCIHE